MLVTALLLPACGEDSSGDGRGGSGGGTGGGAAVGGSAGASGGGSGGQAGEPSGPLGRVSDLGAIGANTTVGLEWTAIPGAARYEVFWSTTPGVTPETGNRLEIAQPNLVHQALQNGTTYYYVARAIRDDELGPLSTEVSATPGGEWVLEEYGTGLVPDVNSDVPLSRIALEQRIHVLIFAEGYTEGDMIGFHNVAGHVGRRDNDVDRWVDLVFGIEPYTAFRQAFVVWYLPRSSEARIGQGVTAFAVPINFSGQSPAMGNVQPAGETAQLVWDAIGLFPYAATDFSGGGLGTSRNNVAVFMVYDPERGQAGVSGLSLALRNPDNQQRSIGAGFGVGPAHEFTHALAALRDEYLEDDNMPTFTWTDKSNVVGTSECAELPWQHLLAGGSINPDREQLVGAFGREQHGYHPELLCLMNGVHDNATYYGGDGLLRVEDRLCNFCREMTALSIYQRMFVLPGGDAGVQTWKSEYRAGFYDRFPFVVPALVPQTNDVAAPENGTAIYEACSGPVAAPFDRPETDLKRAAELLSRELPRRHGCVIED